MNLLISCRIFFILSFVSCSLYADKSYNIYTESIEPISYRVDNDITGVATDIVKEIFDRANIPYNIKLYPWARAYINVLNDNNGLVYPLVRNREREDLFYWIGPILIKETGFWTLAERFDIKPVDNIYDLKNLRIGVTNKESIHQVLLENKFPNLFPVPHSRINAIKLIAGRIDIMPGNNYTISRKFKDKNTSIKKIYSFETGHYYIGVNKSISKQLIDRLNTSFEDIKKSDFIETIHVKYGIEYNNPLYIDHGFGIEE